MEMCFRCFRSIVITVSKSPLPIHTTFEQTRSALEKGGVVLQDSQGSKKVVLAVIGDMTLAPATAAAKLLEAKGYGVRIVAVVNPRRLYRSHDVLWDMASEGDGGFLDDAEFEMMFGGDALIGITGGTANMLEPVMLRSMARRDTFAWKRGETTASAGELMGLNGITAEGICARAIALL
jgi:phosphoketolase